MPRRHAFLTAVLLAIIGTPVKAADALTCAVYYRMQVGSLKSRDLEVMTATPEAKMQQLMTVARRQFDSDFNTAWAAKQAEMTDIINRNYENFTLLRAEHHGDCEALVASLDS